MTSLPKKKKEFSQKRRSRRDSELDIQQHQLAESQLDQDASDDDEGPNASHSYQRYSHTHPYHDVVGVMIIDAETQCRHSTDYLLEVLRDMFPGTPFDVLQQVWERHKPDLNAAVCQLTQELDDTRHSQGNEFASPQDDVMMDEDEYCDWPGLSNSADPWGSFEDLCQQQVNLFSKHTAAPDNISHQFHYRAIM